MGENFPRLSYFQTRITIEIPNNEEKWCTYGRVACLNSIVCRPIKVCVGIKFPLAKYRWKRMCVTKPPSSLHLPLSSTTSSGHHFVSCSPPFIPYPNPHLHPSLRFFFYFPLTFLSFFPSSLNSSNNGGKRIKSGLIKTKTRKVVSSSEHSTIPPLHSHGRAP